ncbi:hypothetical protein J3E64_001727 [Sphingobium sp. OAS761]|uniref:hypothetical protein n=1 Tax=Sphingobium sp. OAS761 TaxID=2817901 RepID=UPI00209D9172|nr:hypothetical protein [Sphingobium sp. OAS761]MCP1470040.1 hypothetical protein [Sphingobium sp. OAS761]
MSSRPSSVRDIVRNPEWLAHRYDPGHDAVHFRQLSRSGRKDIPFFTDEHLGAAPQLVLRRADVMEQAPAAAPLHFLFHSAYCCSTLLVSAFDIVGVATGLKEPVLLNDLIGWRHRGAKGRDVAQLLDDSLTLLARPFNAGEAVIVKPSNIVNPLIPAIMAMRPNARAVLLHAPLDAYLASIARKGMWGRIWVRDLFVKLIREGMLTTLGIPSDDYLGLTDIQVAAAGWLAQQAQFHMLVKQLGPRVATLDSERLVAMPRDSMRAMGSLMDLGLTTDMIDVAVSGPVFAKDAKSGQDFKPGSRAQAARQGMEIHADEIEKVSQWTRMVASNAAIPLTLERSLLG